MLCISHKINLNWIKIINDRMPMGGGKIIIIKVYTLIWARETERRDERVMQERLKKKKKKERDV